MTITKVTPRWGCERDAYTAKCPGYMTAREAAQNFGISTVRFNTTARANHISPIILAGTENHKYSVFLFSPDQITRLREILGLA